MTVIHPQTDIQLLQCPLESDGSHTLTFANLEAQDAYFSSLPKLEMTGATYMRKDGILRFNANFDVAVKYNYCRYRNKAYSDKWFYAFVSNIQYVGNEVVTCELTTDVFQTWQFDLNFKPCFVEREHVNDDTVGAHTIPEGLELGEYEIVDLRNSPLYESSSPSLDWLPCFVVTGFPNTVGNLDDGQIKGSNGYIGGVFTSLFFFAASNLTAARKIIAAYDADGKGEYIQNIYMVPQCVVDINRSNGNIGSLNVPPTTVAGYGCYPIKNYYESGTFQLQQPNVLAGDYHPSNNKLLTYPFSYFYITNNAGAEAVYHYEDFPFNTINNITRRTMTYKKSIVPSCGLAAKLYFTNYKDYSSDATYGTQLTNYGLQYAKVPVCAWLNDYYTNWLTQNGVNIAVGLATGAASIAVGIATGGLGLVAGALGAASMVGNTMAETYKASITPDQSSGDLNTGDFNYAFKRCSISFYEMSIRPEMAKVIDQYFSTYGYKVNTVKVPNIRGRRNWNYVKTIGAYVGGNVPEVDLESIKELLNRGMTFWHNPSTFLDYNVNNGII